MPPESRPGGSGAPKRATPVNRSRIEPLWRIRGRIVVKDGRIRFKRKGRS